MGFSIIFVDSPGVVVIVVNERTVLHAMCVVLYCSGKLFLVIKVIPMKCSGIIDFLTLTIRVTSGTRFLIFVFCLADCNCICLQEKWSFSWLQISCIVQEILAGLHCIPLGSI